MSVSRVFGRCILGVLTLLASLACTRVDAQTPSATPASTGVNALPGVYEVPLALPAARGVAARAGLSYGWTESVLDQGDNHHRLQLDAAGSFTPARWLSTSVRMLGRYDAHSSSALGSDDGIVMETHLGARATLVLGPSWHAGGELSLWLPGGDSAGKSLAAISGDLNLLLAYGSEHTPLSVGLALGLHVNRARYAGGNLERYSAADRLALGASDSILAMRSGLALTYRTGALSWLAELAYRMYFTYPGQSPLWIRAGARYHASTRLQIEALLGVSPSPRPSLASEAPLRVVEPRLWAGLSLTYAWPEGPETPHIAKPTPLAAPSPSAAETEPSPARVDGHVLAPGGAELAGATVSLSSADPGEQAADSPATQQSTTDEHGRFTFDGLALSAYSLEVQAAGFKPAERSVQLGAGEKLVLDIELELELPIGQVRGTVRRFNGDPIAATVKIPELGIEQTTRADGSFEIDVPPGDYKVIVTAQGFRKQARSAHVEQRGVAIVIVELEPSR